MSRTTNALLLLVPFALAATLMSAAPAIGQTEAEIDELGTRRDELAAELARIDADLQATETELLDLDDDLAAGRIAIELIADDYERAVDDRREPANTRIEMAIVGFTNGDPRQNALIDEVLALQGSDENSRARELYSAAIDDAQRRLDAADDRLRDIAAELGDARRSWPISLPPRPPRPSARARQRRSELAVELKPSSLVSNYPLLENTAILTGLSTLMTRAGRHWR